MSIFRTLHIVFLAVCLSGNFVFAQEVIKDSYIILFKKDAGVIDPPNPENAGKVPVGQPTSGQNKDELAAVLELNGEIVAILEVDNGIIVRMNEQEAKKWGNDDRVLSVTQEMVGSFDDTLNEQSEYPVYRDNILFVPRVDTDEQVGIFQEGVLQFDSSINAWRLQNYQVRPTPNIFLLGNDNVELIVSETLPTQVFLKVTGSFPDSCKVLGRVDNRLKENRFEVVISVINSVPGDGPQACFLVVTPFEKIVPLPVYGLSAGIYEYSVNGKITGSFELKNDNTL